MRSFPEMRIRVRQNLFPERTDTFSFSKPKQTKGTFRIQKEREK